MKRTAFSCISQTGHEIRNENEIDFWSISQIYNFVFETIWLLDVILLTDALSPWDLSKSPAQFLHFAGAGPKFQKSK